MEIELMPPELRRLLKREKDRKQRFKRRRALEKLQLEGEWEYKRMYKRLNTKYEGKAKIKAEEEEEKEHTCGICFSGSRRSIRGRINSCDHYFCFVCIMEWAKIETSCPLCKRHFESICRPPVRGVFRFKRVVDVPVRRQVNHRRDPDPYEYIPCSFCSACDHRRRLLVCGLCDLGIHRSCVGLGDPLPQQGNWYCPDCTICKDWHSRPQLQDDSCPQNCSSSQTLNQSRTDDPESIRRAWEMMELGSS
ncbi:PHD and RING finger domain-containing protein 1-like [Zingiber officinale]|uniref:PHD and RING finger domain-containing protein 1-like n=1 Tax=Zingiber officinale TaxID=94328 RepID=UPI001C4DC179|nr:PHD and RING finger domain-containing protein 1-like [Zingiber officinale]